jgi:cyclophilin family peptidyl-prolyl cis-trans isomerase
VSKATKRERQRENRERAREERERMVKRQRRNRSLRSLAFVLVPIIVIMVIITLVSGGGSDKKSASSSSGACGTPVAKPPRKFAAPPAQTIDPTADYRATMCTSEGDITFFLDAKNAPIATNNFVFLARQGFYDGLTFHRASKDFVVQGGDPANNGSGGPGYTLQGEVPKNNYPIGSLAAAKTGTEPAGTFGSQFFIVTGKNGATLPNDYALFGRVNQGINVAQKIESYAPSSGDGTPTKKVTITAVQVTENGKVLSPTDTGSSTTSTTAAKK